MRRKGIVAALLAATLVGVAFAGGITSEKGDVEAPRYEKGAATLTLSGKIDKDSQSSKIADLFGVFLEDINYTSQALDSNLVANGSFEGFKKSLKDNSETTYCWTAGKGVGFAVSTEGGVLSGNPEFGNTNSRYASLTVSSKGYIDNEGYRAAPMVASEGVEYTFSAFIRARDYEGKVNVSLTDGSKTYLSGDIDVAKSDEWIKYRKQITASATATKGLVLRLTFQSKGKLDVDCVRLITGDNTVGFKNYMYKAVQDLSPAFFRFPGGCVIEGKENKKGDGRRNYYDWKDSIGAVAANGDDTVPAFTYTLNDEGSVSTVTTYGEPETRTPGGNIWAMGAANGSNYYEMEYSIGFYEYFLLCESLGAKAVPVLNCGYSCMIQDSGGHPLPGRHGGEVQDFIQDALDLILFAKGDPSSSDPDEAYWAGVRSSMGHPEPFDMDYMGFGNEQWGVYHTGYYNKFLEALVEAREKNPVYATVEPIVGNGAIFTDCENTKTGAPGLAKSTGNAFVSKGTMKGKKKYIEKLSEYGVHDQHYYVNYTDLLANADLYDTYARPETSPNSYYHVFVGEYSANQPKDVDGNTFAFTANSWLTALSEAAMMTGFERNGDIVVMASYAPMFGNLSRGIQWGVDMMFFTESEVKLTPNYYIQQLFMQNTGDYKITSTLEGKIPTATYMVAAKPQKTPVLYYVTSYDDETGDVLIKLVNSGEADIKLNIKLGVWGLSLRGLAEVTEFAGFAPTATYSTTSFAPKTYTIGSFSGDTLGFTAKPQSVTLLRVKAKTPSGSQQGK